MYRENFKVPAHLTLRQRIRLQQEHRFCEACRNAAFVAFMFAVMFIASGFGR